MGSERRLALTRRALKDLKLPRWRTYVGADPCTFTEVHSLVAKLVHLRTEHPTGQEPTLGAGGVPIYNLHGQDPWRGVTWHDEENDIVWLCAASDHNYDLFLGRLRAGQLLPDEADYADLEAWEAEHQPEFLDQALVDTSELLEEAEAAPGQEHTASIAGEVEVALLVDRVDPDDAAADLYLGIQYPRARVHAIEEDLTEVLVDLFFTDAESGHLDWSTAPFPRPGGTRPNEVVVRWRRP